MYYIHTNPDTDVSLLVFFLRFTFHIKFFENCNKQRYDFSKKVTFKNLCRNKFAFKKITLKIRDKK